MRISTLLNFILVLEIFNLGCVVDFGLTFDLGDAGIICIGSIISMVSVV